MTNLKTLSNFLVRVKAQLTTPWPRGTEYADLARLVEAVENLSLEVQSYRDGITWMTNCTNCANLMNQIYELDQAKK